MANNAILLARFVPLATRRLSGDWLILDGAVTLYVLTENARLSESDLEDCRPYLEYTQAHGEPVDARRLRSAIRREAGKRLDAARRKRLKDLLAALEDDATPFATDHESRLACGIGQTAIHQCADKACQ